MTAFVLSPEAEDDIWSIWRYLLGETSISVADRLEVELFEAFAALERMPGIGHRRPDLTSGNVFFFALYQYLIVYRKTTPLEIVAVIHGKRDVERVLGVRV